MHIEVHEIISCKLMRRTRLLAMRLNAVRFPLCLQTTGRVTYNGKAFKDFLPQRTAAYIDQVDNHYPELTVRETFDFAARTQGEMPPHVLGLGPPALVFAARTHIYLPCSVSGHLVAAKGHECAAWAQDACMLSSR